LTAGAGEDTGGWFTGRLDVVLMTRPRSWASVGLAKLTAKNTKQTASAKIFLKFINYGYSCENFF